MPQTRDVPVVSSLIHVMSRRAVLRRLGVIAFVGAVASVAGVARTSGAALAAGSNFTVIRAVRVRVGDNSGGFTGEEQAPFAGEVCEEKFACPNVDSNQMAVLTFESYDVTLGTSRMLINGSALSAPLRLTPMSGDPKWTTNEVLVDTGVLRSSNNVLRVESRDENNGTAGNVDDFLLDNIVIFYKTR